MLSLCLELVDEILRCFDLQLKIRKVLGIFEKGFALLEFVQFIFESLDNFKIIVRFGICSAHLIASRSRLIRHH